MKYVVLSVSVTVCVIAASAALPAEQPARLSGSRSLMDQADRLVSAGENQLALKYYAYALALDPHGELPSGRLAGFLQTLNENGLSEPNWNVFPIPVEASGGVSDEQTAGDRIALARRLAVGRIVPLEASLERLKQRLPQEADLQTIDREDTAWIHPVSEIVPELNQTIADAIAPAAVGRTRPRGVLIYPDFRQALRLGSELRRLAADIGQLDGMLPVETDELTRKGVEFVVQAAAVRQTIDRVLELAQESVAFPENSQDYLARAAAASFPTDRLRSQALSTRLIELEPDRIADLMRARSVFDPVRRGDAQTAVNHFVRCLQSSHQSTGLTPDLWLASRYRGTALEVRGDPERGRRDYDQALRERPADLELLRVMQRISRDPGDRARLQAEFHRRWATVYLIRRAWSRSLHHGLQAGGDPISRILTAMAADHLEETPETRERVRTLMAELAPVVPWQADYCRAIDASLGPEQDRSQRDRVATFVARSLERGLPVDSFERHICRLLKQSIVTPDPEAATWLEVPDHP